MLIIQEQAWPFWTRSCLHGGGVILSSCQLAGRAQYGEGETPSRGSQWSSHLSVHWTKEEDGWEMSSSLVANRESRGKTGMAKIRRSHP